MNNYTAMTKFGLGSPARDWRLFRRFLSLLALALVVALAGLLLTGGDSARVQAQTPSDLTFGDAEFPDLYFVKGSAGDVAPFRGLPQAFQGEGAIRYELVRFSDNAAAPAWIGWDPSVRRGIQPQLDAYRDLRVQYKAIDESGTIAAAIFDVFVGPPQPFPVTTYSGTNRISVLVPNDNIPISHDVDIRRSDNGGRTWGAWSDAMVNTGARQTSIVMAGLTAGAEHHFQLRYCVTDGGTEYCGQPSRATYGRVQDPNNAPTFASNQVTTLTLTESQLVPDVEYLTVTAIDPDGGAVTYTQSTSVTAGAGSTASFMIDRNTGGISVTPRHGSDFISNNVFATGTFTMTVTATAEDGDRATIDVIITTANDPAQTTGQAPVFSTTNVNQISIAERGLYPGNRLATLTAVDPQGDDISFGMFHQSNFAKSFAIGRTSGVITVRPGAEEFVTGDSYHAAVVASDGNGNYSNWNLNISITADPVIANDQSPVFNPNLTTMRRLPESQGRIAGTSLGNITATDPQGDTVTYTQHHDSASETTVEAEPGAGLRRRPGGYSRVTGAIPQNTGLHRCLGDRHRSRRRLSELQPAQGFHQRVSGPL